MEFTSIFNGEALTLEQFTEKTKGMKLFDLSKGDYVDRGKYESDLQKARGDLAEARATIAALEASKGSVAALETELQKYREAEQARQKQAQQAEDEARLAARFTAAKGEREFSSEYAESGVLAAFRDAINNPDNEGKGDNELFDALTRDRDGIFKSKNPPVNMGGFKPISDGTEPAKMPTFF